MAMGTEPGQRVAFDKAGFDVIERILNGITHGRNRSLEHAIVPTANMAAPILDAQGDGLVIHGEDALSIAVDGQGEQIKPIEITLGQRNFLASANDRIEFSIF